MYMCSAECSGTVTPHTVRPRAPIGRRRLTRISQAMLPRSWRRRDGAPSRVATPVTRDPSKIRAPRSRAPLASACVMSVGLALPSPGSQTAPTQVVVAITGHSSPPRAGRDALDRDALRARRGGRALEQRHALGGARHRQRAAIASSPWRGRFPPRGRHRARSKSGSGWSCWHGSAAGRRGRPRARWCRRDSWPCSSRTTSRQPSLVRW